MISILLVLAATALALLWRRWRVKNQRLLEFGEQIPGPRALPLLGNSLQFMFTRQDITTLLASLSKEYGDYMRFWIGPELNVSIKDPLDIREILTSSKAPHKGPWYDVMKTYIGSGLLSGGDGWRQHRKLALPCYTHHSMEQYSEVFNKEADTLAEQIVNKDPKETFDVFLNCVAATTQCVCQTLLGLSKEDSQKIKRMDVLVRDTRTLYTLMFNKATKWWYKIPLVYTLTGGSAKEAHYKTLIAEFGSSIIKMRKTALRAQNLKSLSDRDPKSAMGAVDRFMLSGQLSDQEIYFETITLFTTSQEAAAKILSAVLLFLAHLPEWQDKVYKEIVEVLGGEDNFVTNNDVKKLRMLDVVFKEVLRYLPIAVVIQRKTTEDISLNYGQYTLPAGSSVAIPMLDFHRDPRYWDEPNKVKPERFLPENSKNRDPNTFIPFSLGQMDCLGRVYGMTIVKIMVVKVLRKVVLEADGALEDLEMDLAISASFDKGYNLRAKPRINTH